MKLLEENIGRTFDDINQSKILYDPPPRVTELKIKSIKKKTKKQEYRPLEEDRKPRNKPMHVWVPYF